MKKFRTFQMNIRECNHMAMVDENEIKVFLTKLVDAIGMNIIPNKMMIDSKNPALANFSGNMITDQDSGLSSTIMMFESHCSIHTWPFLGDKGGFCSIVIHSCKDFDIDAAVNWISLYLNANKFEYNSMYF